MYIVVPVLIQEQLYYGRHNRPVQLKDTVWPPLAILWLWFRTRFMIVALISIGKFRHLIQLPLSHSLPLRLPCSPLYATLPPAITPRCIRTFLPRPQLTNASCSIFNKTVQTVMVCLWVCNNHSLHLWCETFLTQYKCYTLPMSDLLAWNEILKNTYFF